MQQPLELTALDELQRRVIWLATNMVHHVHKVRPNSGGIKIGGHQASSASAGFVHDGDAAATAAVVDRLTYFAIAASLGGVESLVTQPITTTHHGLTPEERARRGIVDGMVRLSCGLEDAEDLIADLKQALG